MSIQISHPIFVTIKIFIGQRLTEMQYFLTIVYSYAIKYYKSISIFSPIVSR